MSHPYTHHNDGCLCNRCQEEPRDPKAALEKLRGELAAANDALAKLGQHHSECTADRDQRIDALQAACGQVNGELLAAKSLLEQREAEYYQARIDLAACERKLASSENAATYWEEKAKGWRATSPRNSGGDSREA